MRQIFVDTSAWDAIADSGDPNHDVALLFRDEIAGQCQLVVTNYICQSDGEERLTLD